MRSWITAIDARYRDWLDESEARRQPIVIMGSVDSVLQGAMALHAVLRSYTE